MRNLELRAVCQQPTRHTASALFDAQEARPIEEDVDLNGVQYIVGKIMAAHCGQDEATAVGAAGPTLADLAAKLAKLEAQQASVDSDLLPVLQKGLFTVLDLEEQPTCCGFFVHESGVALTVYTIMHVGCGLGALFVLRCCEANPSVRFLQQFPAAAAAAAAVARSSRQQHHPMRWSWSSKCFLSLMRASWTSLVWCSRAGCRLAHFSLCRCLQQACLHRA